MEQIITTTNRKLEGYLYALGIKPVSQQVLWDGMVQWGYHDTESFRSACDLYKQTKIRIYREKTMR